MQPKLLLKRQPMLKILSLKLRDSIQTPAEKEQPGEMKGETYIAIGKLGKPHGISGAFKFLLEREPKSTKKFPAHFMILQEGSYTPWFIKKTEWTGFNAGIILFEEIISPEKARPFNGSILYLSEADAKSFFKESISELDFLIGYKAVLNDEETTGIIEEIIELPGQTLLQVNVNEKEVMIPYVENFIAGINKRKKEIVFSLPEGLIDI
jgi:16S rRNA processing protein RimM